MKKKFFTLLLIVVTSFAATIPVRACQERYRCMTDGFGYTWHLTYCRSAPAFFTITGTVDIAAGKIWTVTGSWNRSMNVLILTATSPTNNNCVIESSAFTYTGSRVAAGGACAGTWVNNCGSSGGWNSIVSPDACPAMPQVNNTVIGPAAAYFISTAPYTYKTSSYIAELESNFEVFQNVPNPFGNQTTITYSLYEAGDVKVAVYNTMGDLVAVLYEGNEAEGDYNIVWNGTDNSGNALPNGNYFCRITSGGEAQAITMALIR